jgi:HK97 family phage prohead protease
MEKKYLDLPISLKAVDEEKRTFSGAVASDGGMDRHGESLNPNGWKINGQVPLLWGHDYRALPIGKTTQLYVEDGKLMFDGRLSKKYEFAGTVFDLITEGIVEKVSVGFIPLKYDESGQYTYAEMELLEISFVTVPANPRAGLKQKTLDQIAAVEKAMSELLKTQKKDDTEEEPESSGPVATAGKPDQSDENPPEDKPEEKTITLTESELKEVIAEGVKQALEELKAESNEEESTEDESNGSVVKLLQTVQKHLRGDDKEVGLLLREINSVLEQKKS